MYALIENNEIKETFSNIRALKIGNVQYPKNIFTVWSEAERNAIGIYTIVHDNSNQKDNSLYTNIEVSYAFADGKVTASYGTATPKELEDTVNEDDSITLGLKSQKKKNIKQQASDLLTPTDWYILKEADAENYAIPSAVTTYRINIRATSNIMEGKIDACTTVDELAALYVYTDGSRPLGEFPVKE